MDVFAVEVTTTQRIPISIALGAEWFCGLDDDAQAKFFVEVAKIAESWPHSAWNQWWRLGGHLRNCACSTHEAREMVRTIAEGIEKSTHDV